MIMRSNFMRLKLQFFMRSKLQSQGWNSTFSWDQICSIIFDNFDHEVDTSIMRLKPKKALQWAPLNRITLGPIQTDSINRMIPLTDTHSLIIITNFDLMKTGKIIRSHDRQIIWPPDPDTYTLFKTFHQLWGSKHGLNLLK